MVGLYDKHGENTTIIMLDPPCTLNKYYKGY